MKNILTLRIAWRNFKYVLQMGKHFECDSRANSWQLSYQTRTHTSQVRNALLMKLILDRYPYVYFANSIIHISATLRKRLRYSLAGQPDLFSMKLSLAGWSGDLAACQKMSNRKPRIPTFSRITCFAGQCSWDSIHYYLILFWLKDVLV